MNGEGRVIKFTLVNANYIKANFKHPNQAQESASNYRKGD